ncbi:MAG TPA: type II toxin-antitoxin system HipA family toxin YjjJ [Dokdonella sp.]|uniref:type II toxin-antitoxin system HipA family toxin YjjJ n=1 Tax=Dokdonella sp. TaxID=2291710 RepID=UPI002D7E2FFC|nr:type II toxin-antitoxin system HipA family toxin YjjJ [Dokdonella sp.]HET9033737.1 type II toxin-antitoxin system HipA family toxin YjjJ [Dokdonella sp.]
MSDDRLERLASLLRTRGPQAAGVIADELGISQPTVSRLISEAGPHIVRIGRARATRYALAREIARAGSHWPLYRIDADAKPHTLGELHALHGDTFFFEPNSSRPALVHGEFASGLFPGLPWFLDDQRPQGFLGRSFARRVASEIGATEDLKLWSADDIVLALLRHGDDAPGDLVLGEASLHKALSGIITPADRIAEDQRSNRYPQLADAALRGEHVGSAAGGERTKFAVTLQCGDESKPVIVKFSESTQSRAGRRWADLLICEHHASEVLLESGLPAARNEIIEAEGRVFLQSTRFDRTPSLGRRGFVSLAALDAAFYATGTIDWWRLAPRLARDGWIDDADAHRLRVISWFGLLIGNSDMHLGNVGLYLADSRPLELAPVYDMLPMRFRPANSGEIVERRYEIALPAPEQRADWLEAAPMARQFWQRIADEPRIPDQFQAIAKDANATLERAVRHLRP